MNNGTDWRTVSANSSVKMQCRGKDADYPHLDGKTPEASLQLGIGLRVVIRSVVGRI